MAVSSVASTFTVTTPLMLLPAAGEATPTTGGGSTGGIAGLLLAIDRTESVSGLFAFGDNTSFSGLQKERGNLFATYKSRCKDE